MTKFTKLDENNMPQPNTLVWCKRKDGIVYLATRNSKPIASVGSHPSQDCHWFSYDFEAGMFKTNGRNIEWVTNFSDVTVDSWAYIEKPVA